MLSDGLCLPYFVFSQLLLLKAGRFENIVSGFPFPFRTTIHQEIPIPRGIIDTYPMISPLSNRPQSANDEQVVVVGDFVREKRKGPTGLKER